VYHEERETKVSKRCGWTSEEDSILLKHANKYLARNIDIDYRFIATQIQSRTTKQVRERYENSLAPKNRGDWARGELILLVDLMTIHGQNWAKIRDMLPARSYNAIKKKGRKILGEMSPNKRVKAVNASRRRKRIQSAAGTKGIDLKMKTLSAQSKESKTMEEVELLRLIELHREYRYAWKCIIELLGSSRSPAELERTLYQNCDCTTCSQKRTDIEASMSNCRETFKQAWTKLKAEEKKKELMACAEKHAAVINNPDVSKTMPLIKGFEAEQNLSAPSHIHTPILFSPQNMEANFPMPISSNFCKVSASPEMPLAGQCFYQEMPATNIMLSSAVSQQIPGLLQPVFPAPMFQANVQQQFFNSGLYLSHTKIQ